MMRRIIGSVVIVLVVIAAPKSEVAAAERIRLDLNGSSRWWGGFLDDQNDGRFRIMGENEIHFTGETELDNGIVFGVQTVIEQKTDEEQPEDDREYLKKQFLYIQNGFGNVQIGRVDSLTGSQLHVSAPEATGDIGTGRFLRDGHHKHGLDGGAHVPFTSALDTTDDDTRINYLSPSFEGTSFAADFSNQQMLGFGLYHISSVEDVQITTSAAWAKSLSDSGQEFNGGIQFAYDSWTIGGSARRILATDAQSTAWDVGIMRTYGPLTVSLYRFKGQMNRDNAQITLHQLGGKYSVAPGLSAMGTIGHVDYRDLGEYLDWAGKGWRILGGLEIVF